MRAEFIISSESKFQGSFYMFKFEAVLLQMEGLGIIRYAFHKKGLI